MDLDERDCDGRLAHAGNGKLVLSSLRLSARGLSSPLRSERCERADDSESRTGWSGAAAVRGRRSTYRYRGHTMTRRALSPVVGVVLLVVVVTLIAAVAGTFVFALTDETDPAPTVAMELEPDDGTVSYTLRHTDGDTLGGNRTELVGVADEKALHGQQLEAGDTVAVVPIADEVRLVWFGEETSYTLHTFSVDPETSLGFSLADVDGRCDDAEANINANGDLDLVAETVVCDVTGETDTGISDIDTDLASDSVLIGTLDTDGDIDLDSSTVVGDVTTNADDITVTSESDVVGDIVAQPGTNVDIDGDSKVTGNVVAYDGSVSLNNVTVDGHVYADDDDFSCGGGSTLGPQNRDCSGYTPRDPDSY